MDEIPQPKREATSGKAFLEAISHPLRSRILVMLEGGPAGSAEIATELGVPARSVRHQLQILRTAGFVVARRAAKRRNTYEYSFARAAFGYLDDELYAELSPAERRAAINHYLRLMARSMARFVAAGSTYDSHFPFVSRITLALDEEGWRELIAICSTALEQLVGLKGRAAERLGGGDGAGFEGEVSLLAVEVPERGEPGADPQIKDPDLIDSIPLRQGVDRAGEADVASTRGPRSARQGRS
jgi:DNA-binding transcriptional ArsR family regulator